MLSNRKIQTLRQGNMDETTPLLGDSSTTNRHRLFVRQTPLYGSGATSREQASLIDDEASNLDERREDLLPPENCQEAEEIPLGEVVEGLCSAWQRSRSSKQEIALNFFSSRELLSMHLAWKRITRGKRCNFEAHTIAEALALAIAREMTPKSPFPPQHLSFVSWDLAFHADKNLLAANLLRDWKRITEGEDLGRFTLSEDPDYQQLEESASVVGCWQRLAQLGNTILPLLLHFRFQLALHISLIIWPIFILTVGAKYMDCPIAHHNVLYLLMILGSIGCLAVSIRVGLMILARGCEDPESLSSGWYVLRWTESGFLIVFLIQACIFFSTNQSFEPGLRHCVKNFYSANLKINYVSIALLSAYLLVYFKKMCLNGSHA